RSDADARDPYAAPLLARDLRDLPPALVITAGHDVLRDEGELYVQHLREAGVAVELAQYPSLIHGFFGMAPWIDEARPAIERAAGALANPPQLDARALRVKGYHAASLLEDGLDVVEIDPETAQILLGRAVEAALHQRFWTAGHWQPRAKDLLGALDELDPAL